MECFSETPPSLNGLLRQLLGIPHLEVQILGNYKKKELISSDFQYFLPLLLTIHCVVAGHMVHAIVIVVLVHLAQLLGRT